MYDSIVMEIKDARKLTTQSQEDIRRKAVNAVLSGITQVYTAELFGVCRQSVAKWVRAYKENGQRALKSKKRGRPKGISLLSWQAAQIVYRIMDKQPDQLKLPFYLWSRKAVVELIEKRFGITLSIWTIGRYLKRWGFTPQKPIKKAYEQNPEEVKKWLEEEYPNIEKQAKAYAAGIYWGDEMGVRSDDIGGRTYGKKGKTPVILSTGYRFGCNMISAISNHGSLYFMVYKERFTSDIFIKFLKRMIRQLARKIFFIVDRHPVHRSKKVKKWEDENKQYIKLFYLPTYSPELNPDEYVNQDVKSNAVRRQRPRNENQMIKNVRSYLRKRQNQPEVVQRYFQKESVQYAAGDVK